MRQVFTLLVFSYLAFICAAQNNLPPVYEITTDTALRLTIPDSYWQMLEDKGGRLSFEDISKSTTENRLQNNTAKEKIDGKVEIRVKDNGNGIPQKVVDKIFQPFFTTKPTGQGTGLGLSLSYDIVKAHGGELKVETKEGEGSEFIIQLSVTKTLEV